MIVSNKKGVRMHRFIFSLAPLLLTVILIISSCSSTSTTVKSSPSLSSIAWLLGNWENVSPKRTLCEQWRKLDDSTFSGQSFVIRNADTTYLETVRLHMRDGIISYNPTVPDQNEGKSVQFILTSADKQNFTFENPQHDFPKKIVYMLKEDGSLHAHLEGLEKGKAAVQDFYMTRAK